jgi:molecular chaperone Hsp33
MASAVEVEDMGDSYIVTAAARGGMVSVVAGNTTALVAEMQRRHDMTPTVSAAAGRLITGATLLGSALKGRERVSLQIVGDGPIGALAAEAIIVGERTIGARAYARHPDVDVPLNARGKLDVGTAVGHGNLQVTKSYEIGQPYNGLVALETGEIGDDIAAYLAISEQIPSIVALGVLVDSAGIKAAGGIIAQLLPGADETTIAELEERAKWMPPVTQQIVDGATPEMLVRRLVGDDVKWYQTFDTMFACRCTREKVETALMGLGRDELLKMADEQAETEAICDFCRHRYVLTSSDVAALAEKFGSSSE